MINHITVARERMIDTLFREVDALMAQIPEILQAIDKKMDLINTYQEQREEAERTVRR